jgi:hypothetical protein
MILFISKGFFIDLVFFIDFKKEIGFEVLSPIVVKA